MNYKEIYLNNNYEIDDNFTFNLKDFYKYKNNHIFQKTFAIITAFNPNNELLSCIENQNRHSKIRKNIEDLEYEYLYSRGYLDDHSEDGYLIYDISFKEAINLANKYEQYVFFYNDSKTKEIAYYKSKDQSIIIKKTFF